MTAPTVPGTNVRESSLLKRILLFTFLGFLIGAAAGVGAGLLVWHPYGEGSLTIAVLRKCGTRAAPRGDDRCQVLVEDALDTWFLKYYDGDTPVVVGR